MEVLDMLDEKKKETRQQLLPLSEEARGLEVIKKTDFPQSDSKSVTDPIKYAIDEEIAGTFH